LAIEKNLNIKHLDHRKNGRGDSFSDNSMMRGRIKEPKTAAGLLFTGKMTT